MGVSMGLQSAGDTLKSVSAACYLSNRCSDTLSEYNQSGSNLRPQLFPRALRSVVRSPYLLGQTQTSHDVLSKGK